MCISAPTSFFAGSVLLAAGIVCLRRNKVKNRSLFAALPLIFAVQQFSEGFVWLSLISPEFQSYKNPAVLTFLAFAQVLWPFYVPLSVLLMEKDPFRKRILRVLLLLGSVFSVWLLIGISFYPVDAQISNYHILYLMHYPKYLSLAGSITYFAATVLSLFIGSHPRLKILGAVILGTFLVSKLYFADTLISVWCFFAAIGSVVVYYTLYGMGLQDKQAASEYPRGVQDSAQHLE